MHMRVRIMFVLHDVPRRQTRTDIGRDGKANMQLFSLTENTAPIGMSNIQYCIYYIIEIYTYCHSAHHFFPLMAFETSQLHPTKWIE
jgi:hypothetical protein